MLNLTKQSLSLSAGSEVLSLNSNSVFVDNKKSHPCECEDLGQIILMSSLTSKAQSKISADSLICRDSRACGSRMTDKNIGSRMTGKNKNNDNNFTLMSLLPSAAMSRVSAASLI
ncbi:MAG: hypothetical protein J6N49_03715 [Alphaproteobacteria bacterium]|nr:hypothetical protein [Alphaproteobacteria bacterium]